MPAKIYNNVEDHLLRYDDKYTVEDVTSVNLPNITRTTTTISAPGLYMDIEVPNNAHFEAMEFAVNHNHGTNCHRLATPGTHKLEFRIARQKFNTAKSRMEYESVKIRVTGMHKSTENNAVERGNPFAAAEKYAVKRYEEIIDGKTTVLIDVTGPVTINGKDYTEEISNLLK